MMEALVCHPLGEQIKILGQDVALQRTSTHLFVLDTIKVRMQLSRRAQRPGVCILDLYDSVLSLKPDAFPSVLRQRNADFWPLVFKSCNANHHSLSTKDSAPSPPALSQRWLSALPPTNTTNQSFRQYSLQVWRLV